MCNVVLSIKLERLPITGLDLLDLLTGNIYLDQKHMRLLQPKEAKSLSSLQSIAFESQSSHRPWLILSILSSRKSLKS